METSVIEQSNPQSTEFAQEVLQAGGVIAIPTDTVYGIACLVNKRDGIRRLYTIKQRELIKAIPVLIGTLEQTSSITLVINKHPDLPFELTSYPTVGVRMPDHNWLRSLLRSCGPLAATSANISGHPSLTSAQEVLDELSDRVALLIDGGTCAGGIPSTVIDCTLSPVKILREGGISEPVIRRVLEEC